MANILDEITSELGGGAMSKIGAAIGLSPEQTQSAVSAALPALVSGLATNAAQPEGAAKLSAALDKNHGPGLLDSLGPLASMLGGGGGGGGGAGGLDLGSLLGAAANMFGGGGGAAATRVPSALDGGGILGHIFGNQSAGVTNQVAKSSGLDTAKVGKVLIVLAPIVMSALANLRNKHKLDSSGLASSLRSDAESLGAPVPAGATHASEGGFMDKLSDVMSGRTGIGGLSSLFS